MLTAEKRIGIFGGSFDPIHNGHIRLARFIADSGVVDEVWLMVSPLNPLKVGGRQLSPDYERLEMARLAVEDEPKIRVSDFEFHLPKPSYTVDTLRALQKEYTDYCFRVIIGADNWLALDRWKEPETILRDYTPIVYPRPGYGIENNKLEIKNCPVTDISSTELRELIRSGNPAASDFIPPRTYDYILRHHLYE